MIFEPQKYQKGTKEIDEFQFFTFVFFVPFVVGLKMYSSMKTFGVFLTQRE